MSDHSESSSSESASDPGKQDMAFREFVDAERRHGTVMAKSSASNRSENKREKQIGPLRGGLGVAIWCNTVEHLGG